MTKQHALLHIHNHCADVTQPSAVAAVRLEATCIPPVTSENGAYQPIETGWQNRYLTAVMAGAAGTDALGPLKQQCVHSALLQPAVVLTARPASQQVASAAAQSAPFARLAAARSAPFAEQVGAQLVRVAVPAAVPGCARLWAGSQALPHNAPTTAATHQG